MTWELGVSCRSEARNVQMPGVANVAMHILAGRVHISRRGQGIGPVETQVHVNRV